MAGKGGTNRDVGEKLHLGRVANSELLYLLLVFLKSATGISPLVHRYGTEANGAYVDVEFAREGSIRRITSKLSDPEIAVLGDRVRTTLLENQTEMVAQTFCFSENRAVQGIYRYKDMFQILPIPPCPASAGNGESVRPLR